MATSSDSAQSLKHIDFIDGLRAFSIFLVILEHMSGSTGFPKGLMELRRFYAFGKSGVLIFFVISGFLITSILLKREKSAPISIKNFYLRRFLRIFPVFYLYLVFVIFMNYFFNFDIAGKCFVYAAAYLFNFVYPCSASLNHLWSLAVEEQFYLIWPWVLKFFGNKIFTIALLIIFIAPFTRVASYLMPGTKNIILAPFLNHADALMIGSVTALVLKRKPELSSHRFFAFKLLPPFCFLAVWLMAFLSMNQKLGVIILPFGNTISAVSTSFIIIAFMRKESSGIYSCLTHPLAVYIGKLSYSIYIWQQFFFSSSALGQKYLFSVFPYNLILVFAVSMISYEFWEKRFLKIKDAVGKS